MPAAARLLEKTLSHLSETLEQAELTGTPASGWRAAQRLDARVKVIGACLITVAAVGSRRLNVVVVLLGLLTAAALWAQIPVRRIMAAWASGFFFAAVVAVPAIFTAGWHTAWLLMARSETSLTCWLLVVMTTPFSRVLRALRSLRVPLVFVAILAMTFRYIFLLIETAQDMLLSRRSRIVGRLPARWHRGMLVSTTGVLLDKSVQMSDDVYQAMTSRGFRGEVRLLDDFEMRPTDWLALTGSIGVAVAVFALGR